jgi:hypothetical protein
MNIALTHIQAAASACICGRNAFVRAFVLGGAVACASLPAFAAQDHDRDGQRTPPQQQAQPAAREQPRERMAPPPQPQQRQADGQHGEQRPFEGRGYDTRAEEQRRQAQQQEQRRPGGRLTPDERRELRRQINEAGMDLYPNTPRR